jgi:SsrA-binding protein
MPATPGPGENEVFTRVGRRHDATLSRLRNNIVPRQIIKSGTVAENRRARFEYSIDDTIEAGVALTGAEIKSLRYGLVNITDGFVQNRDGNLLLSNVVIQPLPTANKIIKFDERRYRQLLLHRGQINRLIGKLSERGATVVPLKLYFNNRGRLKVLLGVGFGKNRTDKRQTIRAREWEREKARVLKR